MNDDPFPEVEEFVRQSTTRYMKQEIGCFTPCNGYPGCRHPDETLFYANDKRKLKASCPDYLTTIQDCKVIQTPSRLVKVVI